MTDRGHLNDLGGRNTHLSMCSDLISRFRGEGEKKNDEQGVRSPHNCHTWVFHTALSPLIPFTASFSRSYASMIPHTLPSSRKLKIRKHRLLDHPGIKFQMPKLWIPSPRQERQQEITRTRTNFFLPSYLRRRGRSSLGRTGFAGKQAQ